MIMHINANSVNLMYILLVYWLLERNKAWRPHLLIHTLCLYVFIRVLSFYRCFWNKTLYFCHFLLFLPFCFSWKYQLPFTAIEMVQNDILLHLLTCFENYKNVFSFTCYFCGDTRFCCMVCYCSLHFYCLAFLKVLISSLMAYTVNGLRM